ncbi:spoT, partial [Symbiodinium sp. KB8]
ALGWPVCGIVTQLLLASSTSTCQRPCASCRNLCSQIVDLWQKSSSGWGLARLAVSILERQRPGWAPRPRYGSGSASCSRASHWSEVCRLYGQLSISGLEKDTTMLSTALTTFEKASQWERSLSTFWRVRREHQLRLDRHTFNAAASSCAAGLQPELAMRTMQDMKRLTIQPDVVTFGAMVTATEKSQLWQRATDLLQLSISQGMPLDVVLASSTISACEKALRWRWALGLAETLRCAHDLMPNEIMCNALISACASAGQWQLALCFLGEMPELELKPSTVSYNAAAEACQRALSWLGAVSILQDMRERTVQTDVITLSLIGAPCECSGQFGTLPSLVSSMLNYSRSRLQAQHAITAVEFLTDHACLQERVAKSFERFEWERLVNKLRELCAPTFAPLASERTSARLFDYELNQYFTLGAFFVDRPVREWKKKPALTVWPHGSAVLLDLHSGVMLVMVSQEARVQRHVREMAPDVERWSLASQGTPRPEDDPDGQVMAEAACPEKTVFVLSQHFVLQRGVQVDVIVGGLLHDTVEDNPTIHFEDLEEIFGPDVRRIVEGETKASKRTALGGRGNWSRRYTSLFSIFFGKQTPSSTSDDVSKAREQAENLRDMFLAMADDYRVILVKLADRLHNMRTLQFMPERKRKTIAAETLVVFAQLAHRLGVWLFKTELEDLSFKHLYPTEFHRLNNLLSMRRAQYTSTLAAATHDFSEILRQDETLTRHNIKLEITGREKGMYSLWEKMRRKTKYQNNIDNIDDIIALRVVLDIDRFEGEGDEEFAKRGAGFCYHALTLMRKLPNWTGGDSLKNYIAFPKPNGYQSLHATFVHDDAPVPLEIQIRTRQMHEVAEYGMAAHWTYKDELRGDGEQHKSKMLSRRVAWLESLADKDGDLRTDAQQFVEEVLRDELGRRCFIFLRDGTILNLSRGCTALDAAFKIHSEVGLHMVHAVINDKEVPPFYQLQNGDRVNIVTSEEAVPQREWLAYAFLRSTRNKLAAYFRRTKKDKERAVDFAAAVATAATAAAALPLVH